MQTDNQPKSGWGGIGKWFLGSFGNSGPMVETRLVTNVPIELAIDKLRGFIADRDAEITKTAENFIRLVTEESVKSGTRRDSDHAVSFVVDIQLSQEHIERTNTAGLAAGKYVHTFIDVKIQPRRDRDRSKARSIDYARRLLSSLQSYLMAREANIETESV